MFRGRAFQRNDFVEQFVQLRQFCRAELLLHPRIVHLHGARKLVHQLRALRRRFDDGTALVLRVALAADQAVALHAREHTGEARAEDERLARDAAGFHRALLAQHAQHTPLLVRQAVAAQAGPRVRHHRLARLQQQARKVAMLETCGHGAGD